MDADTLNKFYPTHALVTGPDIIFLWVARMIIASLEFKPGTQKLAGTESLHDVRNQIPFRDVYFTGLIRDKQGRKMSKSLGNSPDPLDLIAKYGADGLRFGLMRIAPQGQDIRFDEKQIEEGRNFCNKLWNSCRFRLMQGAMDGKADPAKHQLTPFCHHLLEKLDDLIQAVEKGYEGYEFSAIASAMYTFVWDDFCSRFIEAAKADFADEQSPTRQGTLATTDYVISVVLRLLHPFMPFITEELWLGCGLGESTIQTAPYPRAGVQLWEAQSAQKAEHVYQTVDCGRRLRSDFGIATNQKVHLQLLPNQELSHAEKLTLMKLLNLESLDLIAQSNTSAPMVLTPLGELTMPLEGQVDVEKERVRLAKEIEKAQVDMEREEKKLGNADMLAKAPAEKVEEWKQLADDARKRLVRLQEQLKAMEALA
jgi:valyl-tRNA synthetase